LEYKTLIFEKNEGIGTVIINRAQSLNVLNGEVYSELYQVFLRLENDSDVQVVVITGSGEKAFAVGTDIVSMASLSTPKALEFSRHLRKTCDLIYSLKKPVIAAVFGFCLGGGCELTLCADFRIASENARFGQPEINLAIIPGSGGTQRLSRLIGLSRAKELIFFGNIIDANTALSWGLVNKVVPAENLMKEARDMAKNLISKSHPILALAKTAMNNGINTEIFNALDIEAHCFAECFATLDQKEGMKAFLEKRKPQFRNQ
jgi:enoyl-CoA hydratase